MTAGPRPPSSGTGRFAPYLHERWNQGCTDAVRLHAEIQAQGYHGSSRSVRRYLQPLRATLTAPALRPPPPTVREVTRWITSHPGHLTDDETAKLNTVKSRSTQLSATAGHVTAFAEMMTARYGEHLPGWIAAVELDDLPSLRSFTCGIRRDQPAVTNGLTLAHSSGAVEGNICRVTKPSKPDVRPPASISCESESCSAHEHHAESPVHDLCATASSHDRPRAFPDVP